MLNPAASIYTAELYAVLRALHAIYETDMHSFTVYSDSRSVLHSIASCNDSHPVVCQIHDWLIRLSSRHKTVQFCWVPSHVGILGNEEADQAARSAAAAGADFISLRGLPYRDYYPIIRSVLISGWQRSWDETVNNKLRAIKTTVLPWQSSSHRNRRCEIAIARLRIGHTRLTHGHLMEGLPLRYCEDCIVPLTVQHVLVECPTFTDERQLAFGLVAGAALTLSEILGPRREPHFTPENLFRFLADCDLLRHI